MISPQAAINESGLGVLSWWDSQNQADEGNDEVDENEEYNDDDGDGAYEE